MRTLPRGLPSLMLGTVLFAVLWLARTDRSGSVLYGFLLWNLALAWVPVVAAWLMAACLRPHEETERRRFPRSAVAFGLLWLAFLPNAPYVVTDLVHLRARAPIPLWYDVLLLGDAALVGLLAGGVSLRVVTGALETVWRPLRSLVPLLAIPAAGVGITLGRFERLNSWELVTDPTRVLDALSNLLTLRAAVVSSVAAGLLFTVYLALEAPPSVRPMDRAPSPAPGKLRV